MSSEANIRRIDALHELNNEVVKFSQSLAGHLRALQQEISNTLEWLAERERHWRHQITVCANELQVARRALAACNAARDEEGRSYSCAAEAAAVHSAEAALRKAQEELSNVLHWKSAINTKVSLYMGGAIRAREMCNTTISQASTFLKTKAGELDRYAAQRMSSPVPIPSLGSNHGAAFRKAKQEMLLRALDDPLVGRDIKGWVRNELRRIEQVRRARSEGREELQHPYATSIRMPYAGRRANRSGILDTGHRIPDIDTPANLRLEDIYVNRSRPARARRMGLDERIR